LLAAAALSTKNGLAVPAVAGAIAALLVRRRNTDALWASATTVVATVAVALPFGLHRVWEQSVELHLHTGRFHPGTNFRVVREQAWAGDRVLLLLLGAAAIVGAVACVRRRTLDPPTAAVMAAMVVWLGTALAVVVLEHQIWTHHLAVTVLPAAVLVAIALPDRAVVAALVLAVAVPWQLVTLHGVLFPDVPTPSTAAAMDDLREVTPRTALVLTDEPGLAAWAGRRIPPDQVDPSYVRATIGAIDAADVEAAAQRPDVCALLFWSQRYRFMVVVPPPGYARVRHYVGGGDLYLRAPCALPDAGR
jgi:hypothetical protein